MTKKNTPIRKTSEKKVLSSHDEFIQSMTPDQKKEYDQGYHAFLLSELFMAIMKNDAVSVRERAKAAGISATIIEGVRSGEEQNITTQSFFKILQALGCSLVVKKDDYVFPFEWTLK